MKKQTTEMMAFLNLCSSALTTRIPQRRRFCPTCGTNRTCKFSLAVNKKKKKVVACEYCIESGKVEVVK